MSAPGELETEEEGQEMADCYDLDNQAEGKPPLGSRKFADEEESSSNYDASIFEDED